MTKEHRLAIQMWKDILYRLPEWHKSRNTMPIKDCVYAYKLLFVTLHNLNWDSSHCWLCTYIQHWRHPNRLCLRNCPLVSCGNRNSFYHIVIARDSSLSARRRACKQIIKALKKGARPKVEPKKSKIHVNFEV